MHSFEQIPLSTSDRRTWFAGLIVSGNAPRNDTGTADIASLREKARKAFALADAMVKVDQEYRTMDEQIAKVEQQQASE